jgi:signal transduction histidine kinase
MLANSVVLIVLLVEISKLYARVLLAVRAQHREREARLVTGDAVAAMIAHEVKQPILSMIMRAETNLSRLDRTVPDLDKAKQDMKKIAADGRRAGLVIDSIRANFRKDAQARTSLNVDDLIEETIALVRDDLKKHRILLNTEPNAEMAEVAGDRNQLQQVLLNLVTNAIDAMAAEDGARVLSVRSEVCDSEVVVSIADSGGGINSQNIERLFNPLFTTKSGGMGMGLSIAAQLLRPTTGGYGPSRIIPKALYFDLP